MSTETEKVTHNADGSFSETAAPSPDQDPIFDHANGVKNAAVTASATILTPPAGCKFARITSDVTCFVRTDAGVAADDAFSVVVFANIPEIVPVTAAVDVKAYAGSSAVIRCMPFKARP